MTFEEINAINKQNCPKFSSFAQDQIPMPGQKRHLSEILDKEILITDFKIKQSKRRAGTECLQLQFVLNGDVFVLFTGSSVLIDQIKIAHEKQSIPFYATVVKIDKYYSFL